MITKLLPNERLDDLQIKGYEIIQSPGRFCFGMDAVLLSAFARVKKNEKALDLGTGTGILPILLEAKYPGLHYTGLEIQEESADMARRSVSYNGLEERIDIVTGDIKEAASIFGAASFGVITTNPPYMIGDHGLKNQNEALYIASTLITISGLKLLNKATNSSTLSASTLAVLMSGLPIAFTIASHFDWVRLAIITSVNTSGC